MRPDQGFIVGKELTINALTGNHLAKVISHADAKTAKTINAAPINNISIALSHFILIIKKYTDRSVY